MGFGIIDTSTLTAIANAIRTKLGVQTTYKPSEMPEAIESISGGGITPTGTKSITANGTNIDVASYAYADVAVPNSYAAGDEGKVVSDGALVSQSSSSATTNGAVDTTLINSLTVAVPASEVDSGTKSITANGSNQDVVGYAAIDVAVPNSYSQSDEGKVVSNGALVAQSSDSVTQNGTVDTTLINSLTVNVSGGGGGLEYEEGTYTAASDSIPTITFTNAHAEAPSLVVFMDTSDTYINTTAGTMYGFMDFTKLLGVGLKTSSTLVRDGCYSHARVSGSNGSTNLGAAVLADPSTQATNTGFTPNFSSATYMCKAGQTYKWIAIWR